MTRVHRALARALRGERIDNADDAVAASFSFAFQIIAMRDIHRRKSRQQCRDYIHMLVEQYFDACWNEMDDSIADAILKGEMIVEKDGGWSWLGEKRK
jgi:hypothetical protein